MERSAAVLLQCRVGLAEHGMLLQTCTCALRSNVSIKIAAALYSDSIAHLRTCMMQLCVTGEVDAAYPRLLV